MNSKDKKSTQDNRRIEVVIQKPQKHTRTTNEIFETINLLEKQRKEKKSFQQNKIKKKVELAKQSLVNQYGRPLPINPNVSTFFDLQQTDQELNDASSEVILHSSETILSKSIYDAIDLDLLLGKFRSKSEIEKQRFQTKWEQNKAVGTLELMLNMPKNRAYRRVADNLLKAEKVDEFKLEDPE